MMRTSILMMTPICPRLLNLINDFVLLRFRARDPEDLSAIEVIFVLLLLLLYRTATLTSCASLSVEAMLASRKF